MHSDHIMAPYVLQLTKDLTGATMHQRADHIKAARRHLATVFGNGILVDSTLVEEVIQKALYNILIENQNIKPRFEIRIVPEGEIEVVEVYHNGVTGDYGTCTIDLSNPTQIIEQIECYNQTICTHSWNGHYKSCVVLRLYVSHVCKQHRILFQIGDTQ